MLKKVELYKKPESFRAAAKGVLSLLPRAITRVIYRSEGPTLMTTLRWLGQGFRGCGRRLGLGTDTLAPTRTTVFLLMKR
jgi:hypothetical protein